MKYLFDDEGLTCLEHLSNNKTLYAFDYDGTLSEIVEQPWKASLSSEVREILGKLSQLAPTAIISGRSVGDLKSRVDNDLIRLVGNHGVEGLALGISQRQLQETCENWKRELIERNHKLFDELGAALEDKTYSLALHYRASSDQNQARSLLMDIVDKLSPKPRVIQGKFVINMVPMDAPHKGAALKELMQLTGTGFALYIGDDDTDEDVFGMNDPQIIAVRVGEARSKAAYFLKTRTEVDDLLRLLLKLKTSKAIGA